MLQLGFSAKKTNGGDGAAEALQRQGIRTSGNNGVTNAPSATAGEPADASEPVHIALQEVCIPPDHVVNHKEAESGNPYEYQPSRPDCIAHHLQSSSFCVDLFSS